MIKIKTNIYLLTVFMMLPVTDVQWFITKQTHCVSLLLGGGERTKIKQSPAVLLSLTGFIFSQAEPHSFQKHGVQPKYMGIYTMVERKEA